MASVRKAWATCFHPLLCNQPTRSCLPSAQTISSPGPLITFEDEIAAVTRYAKYLTDTGVKVIIALGEYACFDVKGRAVLTIPVLNLHSCAGHGGLTEVDEKMAANVPNLDLIVGGHSHSLLYTGKKPTHMKSKRAHSCP